MAVQKVRHNDKWVYVQNSGGPGTSIGVETDPTVHSWAKQPEKPKYTAEEVGAATPEYVNEKFNQAIEHDAPIFIQPDEPVDAPVGTIWVDTASEGENPVTERQMQDYVGDVVKTIKLEETDPSVPDWAKQPEKPKYKADEISYNITVNGETKTNVADALGALAVGGSGGCAFNLPLLYETTTTEEVRWIDTGNAFEAKHMLIVELISKVSETNEANYPAAGSFRFADSAASTTTYSNYGIARTISNLLAKDYDRRFTSISIRGNDGCWFTIWHNRTTVNISDTAPYMTTPTLNKDVTGVVIGDASALAGTRVMGAGTTLRVWGC